MPRTNLKLYGTDALGNTTTTTINYANPEAENADCLEFTQMLNQFTTNTYEKTEKVVTTELDTEPEKQTPTLTTNKANFPLSEFTTQGSYKIASTSSTLTYNGDGTLTFPNLTSINQFTIGAYYENGNIRIMPMFYSTRTPTTSFTFEVGFTETKNFKAASITMTVTV